MDATADTDVAARPSGVMRFFGKDRIPTIWAAVSALGFVAGFRDISKLAKIFFTAFDGVFERLAHGLIALVHLPVPAWQVKELLIFSGLIVFAATGMINFFRDEDAVDNSGTAALTVISVYSLCFLIFCKVAGTIGTGHEHTPQTVLAMLQSLDPAAALGFAIVFAVPALLSYGLYLALRFGLKFTPHGSLFFAMSTVNVGLCGSLILLNHDWKSTIVTALAMLMVISIALTVNPRRARQIAALTLFFGVLIAASSLFDRLLP